MNIAIITTRIDSTRLTGKCLLYIDKYTTVLENIIVRLKECKLIDKIVIAIPNTLKDLKIIEKTMWMDVFYYIGENDNVIKRFFDAARLYKSSLNDNLIRVTHDLALLNPIVLEQCIKEHIEAKVEYTSNIHPETWPETFDCEIFTFKALEKQYQRYLNFNSEKIKEHVTFGMHEYLNSYNVTRDGDDLSHIKLSIDTEDDLLAVQKHIKKYGLYNYDIYR